MSGLISETLLELASWSIPFLLLLLHDRISKVSGLIAETLRELMLLSLSLLLFLLLLCNVIVTFFAAAFSWLILFQRYPDLSPGHYLNESITFLTLLFNAWSYFRGVWTYLRDTAWIKHYCQFLCCCCLTAWSYFTGVLELTLLSLSLLLHFYCMIVFERCPDLSPRHCLN